MQNTRSNQSNNQSRQTPPREDMYGGDLVTQLPIDETIPTHDELRVVDSLFKQKKGMVDRILENTKDVLIVGILFAIFSIPTIDNIVKKFCKSAETSVYILILIKTLLFMFVFFLLKNFYLVRKN